MSGLTTADHGCSLHMANHYPCSINPIRPLTPYENYDHHRNAHDPQNVQYGHRVVGSTQLLPWQPSLTLVYTLERHDNVDTGLPRIWQQLPCRNISIPHARANYLQQDNNYRFDEGFKSLRLNPSRALDIAEEILTLNSNLSQQDYQRANLMKARALLQLGNIDDCLQLLEQIPTPLNKGLLMTYGRALQAKNRPIEALSVFQNLYDNYSKTEKDHILNGLALGQHYQCMGGKNNQERALDIYTRLRTRAAHGQANTPCDDKKIELALGRHYQIMGGRDNLERSFYIFTRLRTRAAHGQVDTPCYDKEIELALGQLIQIMGGRNNLEQALHIFTRLRIRAAHGQADTPCDDKDIELTLGQHYQIMGGRDNLERALAIFTGLRIRATHGQADTPCDDKEIELALGKLYQIMCGRDKLEKALDIFTRLRTRAAHGQADTPCDDKDIELALGRYYQSMGGRVNVERALDIFTRLRTRATHGQAHTLCDDKEIELALGNIYVESGNWQLFDQMQLDKKGFTGAEVPLCISIRYFLECIACKGTNITDLLGKAIHFACNATEESGYLNASSLSQLGHCVRMATLLTDEELPHTFTKDELANLASTFFTEAYKLDPNRQELSNNNNLRKTEHGLLKGRSSK